MKPISFIASLAAGLCLAAAANAAIVWTGPSLIFTKPNGESPALLRNQDHLTPTVWLTRANTRGLFNIQQEPGYVEDVSPAGTEWAFGSAADWQSLTFAPWETWAASKPLNTLNKPAVLHLVADDIYLDIKFLSWTSAGQGGGFSYQRSTFVPEPSALLGILVGAAGLSLRRRQPRS